MPGPLALVLTVATILAGALARVVPPGRPYDEPAHWANVLYIGTHGALPVLGDPGTSYEAQMGPAYYVPSAAVVTLIGGLDDPRAGFFGLRLAWLVLVPALGLLTHALGRRWGLSAPAATGASAVVVLNPTMLAVGSSVQNDYLCITISAAAALVLVIAFQRPGSRSRHLAVAGTLIGLATLTKLFAVGLLVGALTAVALDRGRPMRTRLGEALALTVPGLAVTGWWFVRNLRLYGDLTGQSGVAQAGYSFPPLSFDGLSSVSAWLQTLVSYGFVPTEYYRNAFDAPLLLRVAAAVLTLALVVLLVRRATSHGSAVLRTVRTRPDRTFVWASIAVTTLTYAVSAWTIQAVAPRVVFVVAPLVAVVLVGMACGLARWRLGGLLVSTLVAVFVLTDVWLVWRLGHLAGDSTFIRFA